MIKKDNTIGRKSGMLEYRREKKSAMGLEFVTRRLGSFSIRSLQPQIEKLLNRVCIPFVNGQSLLHFAVGVHQLDDRIGTGDVLDLKTRVLRRPVALHERLQLWVRPQTSSTHLEASTRVLARLRRATVSGTAA